MIKKRGDNSWQIIIYLGRDIEGKKDYFYETYHAPRKSMVQAREQELKRQLNKKTGPHKTISTVGELLVFWRKNIEDMGKASERACEVYDWHIRRLKPIVGHLALFDLNAFSIQQALAGQFTDVSTRTQKNFYSTLRTVLRRGYSWGLMPYDVTGGIIMPRVETREKPILDFEQLLLLLDVGKPYKHYLIVRLLVVTGARLSEILGLRWCDIDFDTGQMKILKTVDSRNRKTRDRTKTKNSKRNIILDEETLKYLQKKKQLEKVIAINQAERLVFYGDDGKPMRHRAVELTLQRILKKANLIQIGIHCLRHSVHSILNDAGIPIADIIALSGHANLGSLETYLHMTKTGLNLLDTLSSQPKSQPKQ